MDYSKLSFLLAGKKLPMSALDSPLSVEAIEAIAHGLAHQARWNGQLPYLYSIAQHSLYVSMLLEKEFKQPRDICLAGLLHDAGEAFIGDISTPVKSFGPTIQKIEDHIVARIFEHFHLDPAHSTHPYVQLADRIALYAEMIAAYDEKAAFALLGIPKSSILQVAKLYPITMENTQPQHSKKNYLLRLAYLLI